MTRNVTLPYFCTAIWLGVIKAPRYQSPKACLKNKEDCTHTLLHAFILKAVSRALVLT